MTAKPKADDLPDVLGAAWSLLGQWFCVRASTPEEPCLALIVEALGVSVPVRDPALIRDRLYGGFACEDYPDRRHVYMNTGAYTYTRPELNKPLTEDERRATWKDLIEANGEPGNGPFTNAGPAR